MTRSIHIKWAGDVAGHDYAAAQAYLSLKLGEDAVADIADGFHRGSLVYRLDPYAELPMKLAD